MALTRKTLEAEHTRSAIRERLGRDPDRSYLRDFIYGAIDGAVTTFAVVSGVAGASLDSSIVIILGTANLVADGFSMAASNYLAARAEAQERERLRRMEEDHIAAHPAGEAEEIREIFRQKGFEGPDLERAVEIITSNQQRWVKTMLTEEHGISLSNPSPWRSAAATFAAFIAVGFLPLASFVWQWFYPEFEHAYLWSAVMTGAAFFLVGAWKSRFVEQHWLASGLETLALGGSAAALAYVVGAALGGLAT